MWTKDPGASRRVVASRSTVSTENSGAGARASTRVRSLAPTVFSEFSALAARVGAVNLGQGFPDFDGAESVREAAVRALRAGQNQYAPGIGAVSLRRAVARHAERFHRLTVDPDSMVVITCGATEAIFDAIQGLVDPGDEVVLFEPFYDSYAAGVLMAGGLLRPVPLCPPDGSHPCWWFDAGALEAAFSARTRLVLLNTPHNPTGKVFGRAELEQIAALCQHWGAVAVVDEVYEHLTYGEARHLSLATLSGMAERTLTVSSAAKTFGFTGWKVGWAMGPRVLRDAVLQAHQYVTFAVPTPLQEAVATALELPDSYFAELQAAYARRRGKLLEALEAAGLTPWEPEGAYFACTDVSGRGFADDDSFCRHLTTEVGVAAIPLSAFYLDPSRAPCVARFAFCKSDTTLDEAARRLRTGRPLQRASAP
jgi:N-succinyldiaminopimelate aminotransferase